MKFWAIKKSPQDDFLSWVTPSLAVGHAPMSYDHLDRLKKAGIDSIINLCAEFPDLPLIEQKAGFDVYYLPIEDEEIPEMETMDDALEWIDESIYLGKKVLVHCRHGIGRTGTIVSAYLLRKGLSAKLVQKKLKKFRSKPASYCQWQLLRKYGRSQCPLKTREPSLEHRNIVDLNPFFNDLEVLLNRIEREISATGRLCGREHMLCCREKVEVSFVEAVYLSHKMNTMLSREKRHQLISLAVDVLGTREASGKGTIVQEDKTLCPLNMNRKCFFYDQRPLACRLYDYKGLGRKERKKLLSDVRTISENLFLAFSGSFLKQEMVFDLNEVISGKYVQKFFYALMDDGKDK
ncbi:protein-tyrosine phosphatase family protein [Desulfonatronovibrio hydrogenovorans]|uniref:protein-tyrosine phosphatase family protein n=1 Tax=Desulfonatronovibrio hydrogenovorans TaxID=53245 RepID=UPI00068F1C33|nr:dual specificity protein phosphatase family protein [Desulfonatronovibrio hydrogenovorans]